MSMWNEDPDEHRCRCHTETVYVQSNQEKQLRKELVEKDMEIAELKKKLTAARGRIKGKDKYILHLNDINTQLNEELNSFYE